MLTLSKERKFHLIFAQRSESSRAWKFLGREFQGTKAPGSESSMYGERKHVGTKVPATQFYYRYQGEGVLCEMRNCEKVYFAELKLRKMFLLLSYV